MKKDNGKKITVITILALLISAIVFAFVMCGKMKNQDTLVDAPIDKIEEEKEEPEEQKPTVIRQEEEVIKGEIYPFKYGVTQQLITYNTYDVYSDGTRKLVKTTERYHYNHKGYNATMDQLNEESQTNLTAYLKDYEEMVRLVNALRKEAGVAPVELDTTYCLVAGLRAAEIEYSGVYSHQRPDDTGCFQVTQYYGVEYAHLAENIAQGYQSPKSAISAWKKNETYYNYMIDARFTKIGVGYSNAGINHEWVLVFAD